MRRLDLQPLGAFADRRNRVMPGRRGFELDRSGSSTAASTTATRIIENRAHSDSPPVVGLYRSLRASGQEQGSKHHTREGLCLEKGDSQMLTELHGRRSTTEVTSKVDRDRGRRAALGRSEGYPQRPRRVSPSVTVTFAPSPARTTEAYDKFATKSPRRLSYSPRSLRTWTHPFRASVARWSCVVCGLSDGRFSSAYLCTPCPLRETASVSPVDLVISATPSAVKSTATTRGRSRSSSASSTPARALKN
ncbi:MAG: hypothetical protein JWP75_3220 [Frondihabitans sp.]|nr:hypothetical protein [Frondihabitans sp.]